MSELVLTSSPWGCTCRASTIAATSITKRAIALIDFIEVHGAETGARREDASTGALTPRDHCRETAD